MLPLIPILAVFAIFGGGVTLWWYDQLDHTEKEAANQLAGESALALFNKAVGELTESQARVVHDRDKRHFMN